MWLFLDVEPYELQQALNNHYAAEKLSHLVCKHHNEWAYGGKYLSGLIAKLDQFYKKAIEKNLDGKVADNKAELDVIKQERIDAFEAKVKQLAIWEDIEVRESSYKTKFVQGALMTNPITMGEYLTYKAGKWIYERMAYGDKKEEAIPLSPFPIANPVVSHFHPVAFVEQMRRMEDDPYTIRITREAERWTGTNKSSMTFGTFVFGSLEGFICEPYGDETTERGKDKRIPAGIYNVKWHVSGNYPKNKYTLQHKLGKKWHLDYPSFKHGVLLVYNESVPQSRGILVHAGQDGGWTEGCILPSSKQDRNLDKWNMTMADSVETLHKIFNQIEETGIENIKLVITDETE